MSQPAVRREGDVSCRRDAILLGISLCLFSAAFLHHVPVEDAAPCAQDEKGMLIDGLVEAPASAAPPPHLGWAHTLARAALAWVPRALPAPSQSTGCAAAGEAAAEPGLWQPPPPLPHRLLALAYAPLTAGLAAVGIATVLALARGCACGGSLLRRPTAYTASLAASLLVGFLAVARHPAAGAAAGGWAFPKPWHLSVLSSLLLLVLLERWPGGGAARRRGRPPPACVTQDAAEASEAVAGGGGLRRSAGDAVGGAGGGSAVAGEGSCAPVADADAAAAASAAPPLAVAPSPDVCAPAAPQAPSAGAATPRAAGAKPGAFADARTTPPGACGDAAHEVACAAPPYASCCAATMIMGVKVSGPAAAPVAAAAEGADAAARAYSVQEAVVRAAVDAAVAHATGVMGLQVLRVSVSTFPGCVLALVGLLLPGGGGGGGGGGGEREELRLRVADETRRQLARALGAGAAAALRVQALGASPGAALARAAQGVALAPAVAPQQLQGQLQGQAGGGGGGEAVEVAVALPEELREELASQPPGTFLRVCVTCDGDRPPACAEARWDAAAAPRVARVLVPPALLAGPLAWVTLLLSPPPPAPPRGRGGADDESPPPPIELVVTQLPLLALPSGPRAELLRLYDSMVAAAGGAAGAATARQFAPLARDLGAVLLLLGRAGDDARAGDGVGVVAAGLRRFLCACGLTQTLSLMAPGAAASAAATAARAAANADGSACQRAQPEAAPPPQQQRRQLQAGGDGGGGGGDGHGSLASAAAAVDEPIKPHKRTAAAAAAAAAAARATGEVAPPRASPPLPRSVTASLVLRGFADAAAEAEYARFKAARLVWWDVCAAGVKVAKDVITARKAAAVAAALPHPPPVALLRSILLVGSLPYLAMWAHRRAWLGGAREPLLLASRLGCAALGVGALLAAPGAHMTPLGVRRLYERPYGTCAWVFVALPALQRLTMRTQALTVPCTLALSFVTLNWAAAEVGVPALLAALALAECVECGVVFGLEWSMRGRFLRSAASPHVRAG